MAHPITVSPYASQLGGAVAGRMVSMGFGLMLLESGRLSCSRSGDLLVHAPALVVFSPETPYRVTSAYDDSDAGGWLLQFCASCLAFNAPNLPELYAELLLGASPIIPLNESQSLHWRNLFQTLGQTCAKGTAHQLGVLGNLMQVMFNEAKRAEGFASSDVVSPLVFNALSYVQQHRAEVTIVDVAEALSRSPSYLTTQIKKHTGHGLGEWLAHHRLARACWALSHSEQAISDIAQDVGWADATHFIRQFKKNFGMPPAAWRRQFC